MVSSKRIKARLVGLSTLLLLCISLITLSQPVIALTYGADGYGNCAYNYCPAVTVAPTPTGLRVAINLTNGQVIPLSGYTIVITPLNGKGSSFKQADIYSNGKHLQTVLPDETGTARWLWVPLATGSTTITVVITDTNGAATTRQFTVKVQPESAPITQSPAPKHGVAAVVQSVTHVVGQAVKAAVEAIKALPKPAVHTLPYVLFLLLAADALLLLFQAQREVREAATMRELAVRARQVDEAKRTFIELTSHFLRTPLTAILGGVELLRRSPDIVSSTAIDLQAAAQDMRDKVEWLLNQTKAADQAGASVGSERLQFGAVKLWHRPGLFAPIGLIATLWLTFTYLARRARAVSVGQVELGVQILVFTIIVLVVYVLFRHRQLKQRDTASIQQVLAREQATARARDTLIFDASKILTDDLQHLDGLANSLIMNTVASKLIVAGEHQFRTVLDNFSIAGKLYGTYSTKPLVDVSLSDLLAQVTSGLKDKLTAKTISLNYPGNATIQVREPELLILALSNLLDNAIAYSSDKGGIEVTAEASANKAIVTITDHGSGIPEEKLALLLQPFSRAESVEVFTHAGMGFSLYLDRLIMAYLGGSISLKSKEGQGTTVILQLPLG